MINRLGGGELKSLFAGFSGVWTRSFGWERLTLKNISRCILVFLLLAAFSWVVAAYLIPFDDDGVNEFLVWIWVLSLSVIVVGITYVFRSMLSG